MKNIKNIEPYSSSYKDRIPHYTENPCRDCSNRKNCPFFTDEADNDICVYDVLAASADNIKEK